jgi:hypothetical protein
MTGDAVARKCVHVAETALFRRHASRGHHQGRCLSIVHTWYIVSERLQVVTKISLLPLLLCEDSASLSAYNRLSSDASLSDKTPEVPVH